MKRMLEYSIGILLFFMFLTTFFQVLARSVLQISAVWSEELARFSFVLMVFLGAAVLIKEDGLIRVTSLSDRINQRIASFLRIIVDVAITVFLAVITYGAWLNTRLNWNSFAPTVDWLRIGYIYFIIAIAGLLMLWYQTINLVGLVQKLFRKALQSPEGKT
jgi:TRAP-type C4-dicarboxylate transport system permease small subunit